MKIETTRFGPIEVEERDFIYFKGAILGFERLNRFVLLIHDDRSPFWWLQCVDDPAVAFVVINPRVVMEGYNPPIYEHNLEFLGIKNDEDVALLTIVTIRANPFRITVNLRAPLLINAAKRLASQIVLEDEEWPLQYDILDKREVLLTRTEVTDPSPGRLGRQMNATF